MTTTGSQASTEVTPLPAERFLGRESSWLAFNERVLELAEDPTIPLLERARFLAIFSSNLDEFFMVRVAGLKRRMATGIAVKSASGQQPRAVLGNILDQTRKLVDRQSDCFHHQVVAGLLDEGIEIPRWADLTIDEADATTDLFRTEIFPVLTPLAVDPAHPFPYISGLSLNLAVVVRNPSSENELFARVKVPPLLPRFLQVSPNRFVPLEDVIAAHLQDLFPGMDILQHHSFRVTRNEDVEVEEDDAENLLDALERELTRRRFGPPVRLEVEDTIEPYVLDLLMRELQVTQDEVFSVQGPLDLSGLQAIAALPREDLKFATFLPKTHPMLAEVETSSPPDVIGAMRHRDILLHHPYDSFATSVQRFLEQAAADPKVLAIKQTLYRTSGDSPIVDALVEAAEAGKQVLAVVEIKARFDEEANITWARTLEQAGVHVVYGLVGLKTHCKLSMVVRRDSDGLRRYTHIGTGNYHPKTARSYEDLGLLTADPAVGEDVADLFNQLSGYARTTDYERLLVAPHSVRNGLVKRINREVENHLAGKPAGIRIKTNAIVDEACIDALYRASQAGVTVEVWVRGICAIRPGVPGLSDNIKVRSILGRFLEHSRIFCFINGGDTEVWIGSSDLMHRNLDRRVEALVRLDSPDHVREIEQLFDLSFADTTAAWHLQADGQWLKSRGADGEPLNDLQEMLIALHARRQVL
ncbi:MAG: RNA degradosome polyphosphate kinase [Actinomycetes bacterium]